MKIVGGSARGRIIEAPPGRNTRPTSAVLREALFGILSGTVPQARVLDLFCGGGAIALEAISRGAKQAVLIDADAKAIQTASKNCKALRMDEQCRIYRNDFEKALRILKRKGEQFDFVYVDPPYQGGLYEAALSVVGGGKGRRCFGTRGNGRDALPTVDMQKRQDTGIRHKGHYLLYRSRRA